MNVKQGRSKLAAAFSLIELMVVVAIIALLTAIAVPSYKTYIQQARVSSVTNFIQNFEELWQAVDNGSSSLCPANTMAAQGTYISQVTYTWNSTITCNSATGAGSAGNTPNNWSTAQPNGVGNIAVTLNAQAAADWGYTGTGVITVYPTQISFGASGSGPQAADSGFVWDCMVSGLGSSANNATLASLLGNLSGMPGCSTRTTGTATGLTGLTASGCQCAQGTT